MRGISNVSHKAGVTKVINEIKDRTGSSIIAIKNHMQANLTKDKKWMNYAFLLALNLVILAGYFVQIKNLYKLLPEFKQK
mmetsp:Transcript_17851/g.51804  ORF Transcript_17851/g.51804 Transcript_17851/m.51804 type:complete len:80 (+) Transcript_17851:49-288(+)